MPWDLAEILSYAIAYGLYLTGSTIAIILKTTFYDKFGVTFNGLPSPPSANDAQLHTVVYLQVQVAMISQVLIFVTRSHGFFFMERPSVALIIVFFVARLVSIIAAYGDWGFTGKLTQIRRVSGGWIGIVWVWNIVWFAPLEWAKFAMKATIIKKKMCERYDHEAAASASEGGVPITRTQSRATSIHGSM